MIRTKNFSKSENDTLATVSKVVHMYQNYADVVN
jgi:hypothetical protein